MNYDISDMGVTHTFLTGQKYLPTKYLFESSMQLKWSNSESPEQ